MATVKELVGNISLPQNPVHMAFDAGNEIGQALFGEWGSWEREPLNKLELSNVVLKVNSKEDFKKSLSKSDDPADCTAVEIQSDALSTKHGNYFVGNVAIEGRFKSQFERGRVKAKADETVVLGLSMAGIYAIKSNKFPRSGNVIHADFKLSTALPVNETLDDQLKEDYRKKLLNNGEPHIIKFHNLNEEMTVMIRFVRAIVNSEATLAHLELTTTFDNNRVVPKKVEWAGKTYLIPDLGGGTFDVGIIQNGNRPDSLNSYSTDEIGMSLTLDDMLKELSTKYPIYTRQHLIQELLAKNDPERNGKYGMMLYGKTFVDFTDIVKPHLYTLAGAVLEKLEAVWRRVPTAHIAVMIGGAFVVLREYIEELNEKRELPMNIHFLDPEDSRWTLCRACAKINILADAAEAKAKAQQK